jgi:hypothetical protein
MFSEVTICISAAKKKSLASVRIQQRGIKPLEIKMGLIQKVRKISGVIWGLFSRVFILRYENDGTLCGQSLVIVVGRRKHADHSLVLEGWRRSISLLSTFHWLK